MLPFWRYGIITTLLCYLFLRSYSELFVECECDNKTSQCYIKAWNDGYLFFDRKPTNDCNNQSVTTIQNPGAILAQVDNRIHCCCSELLKPLIHLCRDERSYSEVFIECECVNKASRCYIKAWRNDVVLLERKPTNDCNNQSLTTIQNPGASCEINGYTLFHHEQRHITVNGNEACIYCACHVGEIKCIHHINETSAVTCEGQDNCTQFMNSEDIKEKCAFSKLTYCFAQNTSLVQYGCLWDCMEGVTVKILQHKKTWCQNIVTDSLCRKCPEDKERFVRDNKDLLWSCKSGELIWRYKICDSYQDCSDGSDEMNCTQQFCSPEIILFGKHEYLSPSQFLLGESFFVNCTKLSPTFYDGVLEFKCGRETIPELQMEYNILMYDVCQCKEELGFEFHSPLGGIISESIILDKLSQWSRYRYKKVNDVLKIKSAFMDYVNSTVFDEHDTFLRLAIRTMMSIPYSGYCDKNVDERRLVDEMIIREKKIATMHNIWYRPPFKQGTYFGLFSKLYQSLTISDDFIQIVRIALNASKANSYSSTSIATGHNNGLTVKPSTDKPVDVEMLDKVLTTISLLCLSFGVVFLIIYRKNHNKTKFHLHINLMTVYALSLLIQLTPSTLPQYFKQYQTSCKVMAHAAYYTIFSTFTWISSEGINIIIMLCFTLECKPKLLYYAIGYGIPALLVTVLSCVSHSSFTNSQNCVEIGGSLLLTKWPAMSLIMINIALLLVVAGLLVVRYKQSAMLRQTTAKISGMFFSCFALAIILGGTFVMGLFVDEASIAFSYAHVILNRSTGIIMFLFHAEGKTMIGRCLDHVFKKTQSVVSNP